MLGSFGPARVGFFRDAEVLGASAVRYLQHAIGTHEHFSTVSGEHSPQTSGIMIPRSAAIPKRDRPIISNV
jgi:hypothetical protein